jgi:hypothetical protein
MEKRRELDNKVEKCVFIGYKYGLKCYKIWNLVIRKTIYSCDVIFREVKSTPKNGDEPKEIEPEKIELELENGEYDSIHEEESNESYDEEESYMLFMRGSIHVIRKTKKYSPCDFCFAFVLSATEDDSKTIIEATDLEERKLSKKAMVEEI